ncbi:MAG TPA: hypothetical protein VL996_00370 [Methylocella sp.]|nr:hypothetical protein [Methylocella sp.]
MNKINMVIEKPVSDADSDPGVVCWQLSRFVKGVSEGRIRDVNNKFKKWIVGQP